MEAEARPSGPGRGEDPERLGDGAPGTKDGADEEEGTLIRPAKRARTAADGEMRRVAEIVLVLSAMAGVRGGGGRQPTEAEVRLMAEGRSRLVEVCKELSPKDLVGREAVGAVIEDLGLNWKVKDQRLGFRGSSRLSIKERVALSSKRKVEETKKFSVPSTVHPSQMSQPSFGQMAGIHSPSSNIRTFDKPSSFQSPPGVLPASSPLGHAASISSSMMHHPMTPEIRAATASAGLTNSGLGRDLPVPSFPRADRSHIKLEGAQSGTPITARTPLMQANASASQPPVSAATWPMHSHLMSSAKPAMENNAANHIPVKVEANADSGLPRTPQAARDQTLKPTIMQNVSAQIQSLHQPVPVQGVKQVQPSGFANNHSEIAKIVQKVLHPKLPECPSWTPPSRDYINKALICQICKVVVHEVETIVLCDSCEKGFHLKCLEASNQKGIPRAEWHCMKCIALSNGKPLPPKYGRVMRSATPSRGNANPTRVQPSLQKTEGAGQKMNLEKAANGACASQGPVTPLQNNVAVGAQKVIQERPEKGACGSEGPAGSHAATGHHVQSADQKISNSKEAQGTSIVVGGNDVNAGKMGATSVNGLVQSSCADSGPVTGSLDKSPQQNQVSELASKQKISISESDLQPLSISSDKVVVESGSEKASLSSEDIARAEPSNTAQVPLTASHDHAVDKEPVSVLESDSTLSPAAGDSKQGLASENLVEASNGAKEPEVLSSDGLQNVEWVGSALRCVDGKTYYQSCCIGGVTYEIYDYALFPSTQKRLTPSKLQAMWEDNKNASKWVSIKRCYLPGDFPVDAGCPDAPERNEVYESNHEICVMAGLIKGPCEVLSPTKFREKTEEQNQSGKVVQSIFLCNAVYTY